MENNKKHTKKERLKIIRHAAKQVGKPVVNAVLIIIITFLPIFLLTGREGKMFHPLVWTKTLVMLASLILTVTIIPVLMSILMKGKMKPESKNPVSHFFTRIYEPVLKWCLEWKKTVLGIGVLALILSAFLITKLGSEFMPPLNEGTILFMPVALPDASNAEMKRILRIQDKIIAQTPEVKNVLGKAGRINSATDAAPISMIETIIMLKPKSKWRPGMTYDKLVRELNKKLKIPGVTNGWTQPIINRINMLSTGIRTDVGVKIFGQNLDSLDVIAQKIAAKLKGIPGIVDLYPVPLSGGKFLDIKIKKKAIGRYGLSADEVNNVIQSALGGITVSHTIEGRKRFPINVHYAQDFRNSLKDIKQILIQTQNGPVPLSAVAKISISNGSSMINSENALLRGTVMFNVRGRDMGNTINEAMNKLQKSLNLPKGYYIEWSGEWKNLMHATNTLKKIVPIVFLIILLILYLNFKDWRNVFNTVLVLPFSLIGSVIILYLYKENLSVAVTVGFIALFGVAVETGVVMMIYLEEAMQKMVAEKGVTVDKKTLRHYVMEGAVKRLRPKLMTVFVILFGLVPVLWSNRTGIELMRPIALPIIGGIITSAISILLIMPIIYEWFKEQDLKKHGKIRLTGIQKKTK